VSGPQPENPNGFVPVSFKDGQWTTAEGGVVPWYEVQTDLVAEADVQGALDRVLSVYGVSDVVVDAFDQFRKELKHPDPSPSESGQGGS
jgi:hypothetical protein